MKDYETFLKSKVKMAEDTGWKIEPGDINPILKPHQAAMVKWLVKGGRRACFASFGLGKSMIQMETVRLVRKAAGGKGLIVLPLGVRQEFRRDSVEKLKWAEAPKFIRRIEECEDPNGIYLTNYETIRDGKLDPCEFTVVSLDEAACLRGGGSSKTFREFMRTFTGDAGPCGVDRTDGKTVKYRFVATATPSPNDYIELLIYAEFLGVMDISQAKTRFFKRDSTKADVLTLHAHKEEEFWKWVASWALFVQKPSDLGFSDEGYSLPPMEVSWHTVPSDYTNAGTQKDGQMKLLRDAAIGVQDASAEKRISMGARIAKMVELRDAAPDDHCIVWHDLEDERRAIEEALPVISVWGSQDLDEREDRIIGFSNGAFKTLATKPMIAGAGCNFQRHCHWEIFLGIGFKFHEFIQAVHRTYRFQQTETVRIDIICTEAEYAIKRTLLKKWEQHNKMVEKMSAIIKEFGLSKAAMAETLTRKMGTQRVEIVGDGGLYRIVNDDTVKESAKLPANSIDHIITSIPFGNQYEYSKQYEDLGHNDSNESFWEQMEYLTPSLYKALKPGRVMCIHVKDRIVPGGMTGLGFQTVYPFHLDAINHYRKHGFAYLGMKTIVTDVVRENNQTYRLGYTEQCKDGTRMGVGMPEYLLIFRKPQTDRSKGYADERVEKSKDDYTLGKWQMDAHGFARSSGDRFLTPDELVHLSHSDIFQMFKRHSLETVYDFDHDVKIADALNEKGKLPVTFMLLQPQSWMDDVWTDVTRMLTLNGSQWSKGKEMHLCPLQFDIVDRCIDQYSMPGETIFDPFGGLMTVPVRAMKKGRKGVAFELNPAYFMDGAAYCKAMENEVSMPTLFDLGSLIAHKVPQNTESSEVAV